MVVLAPTALTKTFNVVARQYEFAGSELSLVFVNENTNTTAFYALDYQDPTNGYEVALNTSLDIAWTANCTDLNNVFGVIWILTTPASVLSAASDWQIFLDDGIYCDKILFTENATQLEQFTLSGEFDESSLEDRYTEYKSEVTMDNEFIVV